MSDSKLSFSKEIATTLGLEEAILLEYFKTTQEQQIQPLLIKYVQI